jgi:hypothetical protein
MSYGIFVVRAATLDGVSLNPIVIIHPAYVTEYDRHSGILPNAQPETIY